MTISLIGRRRILGTIEVLTGLHIGAGKDSVEIGGIDNPVVRHPITREPYIPGSSIKGRTRFLLEWAFDKVEPSGHPWGHDADRIYDIGDPILRIFGATLKRERWSGGPTRLIVRDAFLDRHWVQQVLDQGLPLTEDKTEVLIDRIQGKAHDRVGPRQTERVPAGARFGFEAAFRLYDVEGDGGTRDRECLNWFVHGLRLLEEDALGGSGSRGYGRIKFKDMRVARDEGGEVPFQDKFEGLGRFDRDAAPSIV
jgi:CRISPR-associated protein Csm3